MKPLAVEVITMPKMTMSKSSKGAAKHFPVKVTTMDAELEFEIEVSMNVL